MIECASILFSLLGEISSETLVMREVGTHPEEDITGPPPEPTELYESCDSGPSLATLCTHRESRAYNVADGVTSPYHIVHVWVRARESRSSSTLAKRIRIQIGTWNARGQRLETDPTCAILTLGSARLRSGTLRMNEAKGALCHAIRDNIHVYARASARVYAPARVRAPVYVCRCAMHGWISLSFEW